MKEISRGLKLVRFVLALMALFWGLTINYYILKTIGANDFLWFLFWWYIPLVVLFYALGEAVKDD